MTIKTGRLFPFGISLLLHALILALLAKIFVRPEVQPKWYEFAFGDDLVELPDFQPPTETVKVTDRLGSGSQPGVPDSPNQSVAPAQTQTEQPGGAIPYGPAVRPGTSEILETPRQSGNPSQAATPSVGTNPYAQSALQGLLSGPPAGSGDDDGSVGVSVQGGKVRFRLPAGYKHNLGTSGTVTLQFKVDRNARPIPGSIISTQQTEGRMIEAAKKVLQAGDLSFVGEPNPGLTCVITFNFL